MRLARPSQLKREDTNPQAWNRFEFGQTPGLTGSTAPRLLANRRKALPQKATQLRGTGCFSDKVDW